MNVVIAGKRGMMMMIPFFGSGGFGVLVVMENQTEGLDDDDDDDGDDGDGDGEDDDELWMMMKHGEWNG